MDLARTRLATWIVLLAMLWGALAPGMARAVVGVASGAPWADICTASPASLPEIATPKGGTQAHGGEHCPWCVNHAGGYALPPAGILSPEFKGPSKEGLAPLPDHRRPQAVVSLPPARAPPAYS